jgi:HTH-type transcriptional regulator/antitoxin HigA
MPTTTTKRRAGDSYLKLIERFPLKTIKTRAEHGRSVAFLSKLAIQGCHDEGTVVYMDTLSQLIEDYEKGEGLKMDLSHLTPVDALRHLMEVHGLTVTALGRLIGSQGTLSDVLSGRRQLSKAMIRKLADHFGVSPAVFL